MTGVPPVRLADRFHALLWDYLVILAILAGATLVGALLTRSVDFSRRDVGLTDLLAFTFSVLPTWLYLTATEAGRRHATYGKQRRGLRVTVVHGGRVGLVRSGVRNSIKLLPWQLAHVAVVRLVLEVQAPVTIAVTYGGSVLLAATTLVLTWRTRDHRALHDLVAGTVVLTDAAQAPRSSGSP